MKLPSESADCKAPGCTRAARTAGFCHMHYSRWKTHGDPSITMRPANGEAQRYFREVVLAYEGDECLIWPFYRCNRGYGRVMGDGKMQAVSNLVCKRTKGPPPTPRHEAAHSCGNGNLGCCTKRHLSWKTKTENEADKLLHGTHNRGERSAHAKLTNDQARELKALLLRPHTLVGLAKQFNVSRATVSDIKQGRRWVWLEAAA